MESYRFCIDSACRWYGTPSHIWARKVDVNEQNPQARGFYEHMGFAAYARSPLDGAGLPFPIVHMELIAN